MTSKSVHYIAISNQFSTEDFEKLKSFILRKGDRKTFRNFDNNNPHYKFEKFDAYLGASIGQQNIYNDEKISDFNELTLKDDSQYYKILVVRKGDIQSLKKGIIEGMKENEVYFVAGYQSIEDVPTILLNYLKLVHREIK